MPTTHDTKNSKWKISPFQCVKTFQSSIHTDIYSGSRYSFYSRHRMYYGEFVCLTFMKVVLIKKKKKPFFRFQTSRLYGYRYCMCLALEIKFHLLAIQVSSISALMLWHLYLENDALNSAVPMHLGKINVFHLYYYFCLFIYPVDQRTTDILYLWYLK